MNAYIASGTELDRIGALYGIARSMYHESDSDYRKKVIVAIMTKKADKMNYNPENIVLTINGVEIKGCTEAEFNDQIANKHKKDYSLLRPFDLEAAKRGEKICTKKESPMYFVAQSMSKEQVFICEYASFMVGYFYPDQLCMAPLAWVEGRPVYREDVLFNLPYESQVEIKAIDTKTGLFHCKLSVDGFEYFLDKSSITWTKPKQKREGWINICKDGKVSSLLIHTSKSGADESAEYTGRVDCIRIEWEE